MSPSLILKAGALALACASTVSATEKYTLDAGDNYKGSNFFDSFDFMSGPDPTAGYVQYQSKQVASSSKFGGPLVSTSGNQAYMGVDHWNKYNPKGAGRPSVRLESKKTYNHGLFILDLAHMPASVCGTWPAFWTYSDVNYPSQGEIDILENIHENTVSLEALHTSPGCSVVGNQHGSQQTGRQDTYNCDDKATSSPFGSQYPNQGCASTNSDPASYGSSFNKNGGGVYAMEWTSDVIQVWNFGANSIPKDIKSGEPDPSKWGKPTFTTAQGKCDIDSHFKNHKVVLDTTFCGNWAGQSQIWEATSCYDRVKYPTCNSYVAANPEKFKDAYWLINGLKVYKKTKVVVPPTSKPTTSKPTTSKPATSKPTTSKPATSKPTTSKPVTSNSVPSNSTAPTSNPVPTTSVAPTSIPTSSIKYHNTTSSASESMTTSTVYTTSVYTVTSCAPTVTNCPAHVGSVTTEIIALYTTVCPVGSPTTTRTFVNPKPTDEPTTTITFINPGPTDEPTTTITFINPKPTDEPTDEPTTTITFINPGPTGEPTTTITFINPGPPAATPACTPGAVNCPPGGLNGTQWNSTRTDTGVPGVTLSTVSTSAPVPVAPTAPAGGVTGPSPPPIIANGAESLRAGGVFAGVVGMVAFLGML